MDNASDDPISLRTFLRQRRAIFTDRLGHNFETKRRGADMRQIFERAVRRKHKHLAVLWHVGKHGKMAKTLFETYDAGMLRRMIDRYVERDDLHEHYGLTFTGFYFRAELLATQLAAEDTRATTLAVRQTERQVMDTADPTPDEVAAFIRKPFFKKLPKIFQESLLGSQKD